MAKPPYNLPLGITVTLDDTGTWQTVSLCTSVVGYRRYDGTDNATVAAEVTGTLSSWLLSQLRADYAENFNGTGHAPGSWHSVTQAGSCD
jgi:hypothetical protein